MVAWKVFHLAKTSGSKMKILLFLLCGLFLFRSSVAQDKTLDRLFRSAYHVWELQRNDIGVYRDSKVFNGEDYHPCSVANIGIGLISLCIADSMGWEKEAASKTLTSLKSVTGHTHSFYPERNASGFFRHFIDMDSGARFWNSEFSTIDTEILVAGALFAKSYFKNDSISKYANELWYSINHEKAIADAVNGMIYMTMHENGDGILGSVTSVYNEYMIVAWMAKNATTDAATPAHILWNTYYARPLTLPFSTFGSNKVLTDQSGRFLSSFTHLFNYYLCHNFTVSESFNNLLLQARQADEDWWKNNTLTDYWGCGAGTGPEGYHADKINENPNQTVSPQIIAGFLPVFSAGEVQLLEMWNSKKGIYTFPQFPNDTILWRYSLKNSNWKAQEVQGIDYSTLLFGLASLPQFLGKAFFEKNNDFFAELSTHNNAKNESIDFDILLKSQTDDSLIFTFSKPTESPVEIQILNINSEIIFKQMIDNIGTAKNYFIPISNLLKGVYFFRVIINGKQFQVKKFIKY